MGTEPREWQVVADAALPDAEIDGGDRVVGVRLPATARGDAVATPEEAARLRAAAVGAACAHLERHARRVRRGRGPQGAWATRALADVRVCALDLETTGGRSDDAIVEVGCAQSDRTSWGLEFATLVQPTRALTAAAVRVHGIRPEALVTAPAIASVLPYVEELIRDRVVVAHNAPFDVGFLRRAYDASGRAPFAPIVVDTVTLARTLLGGRCGLGHAAHRLGIDAPHVHRALPDARLAAMLWWALVEVLDEAGATTLGEVPGACDLDRGAAATAAFDPARCAGS